MLVRLAAPTIRPPVSNRGAQIQLKTVSKIWKSLVVQAFSIDFIGVTKSKILVTPFYVRRDLTE